jgi:very-short-patch-repair endonuclease
VTGWDLLESPAEARLAEAFAGTQGFERWEVDDELHPLGKWPSKGLYLLTQVRMWTGHRLDFAVARDEDAQHLKVVLAVEVDGHEFHERTAKQASRDKRRDRALAAGGLPTFRFTGSDVYRDAEGCALEALLFSEKAG